MLTTLIRTFPDQLTCDHVVMLSKFPGYTIWAVTEVSAYSDTLGTWEKCHCNQIVTVTRGSLVINQSFGTCQKCHCKRGVTVNSVTLSGEICHNYQRKAISFLVLHLSCPRLLRPVDSGGPNDPAACNVHTHEQCHRDAARHEWDRLAARYKRNRW